MRFWILKWNWKIIEKYNFYNIERVRLKALNSFRRREINET